MAWLFLTAGFLGIVSVLVPHDPETVDAGVVAVSALSLGMAACVWRLRDRLGRRGLSTILFAGTLLVSAAIHLTAGVPNATASLYTWIALYAFYALGRRAALAQTAAIAAVYALVIAVNPPPFPVVAHWTTTIGTLIGAGLLVSALKSRLDGVFERLERAARTDPLTGLVNRRGFRELLDAEAERAHRTGRPFALIVTDLDRFKLVNDIRGHAAGDEVLRGFSALLREGVRAIDTAARIGGEEFALLLPETTREEAIVLGERLRRDLPRRLSQPGIVLTGSFGVAVWPEDGPTPEALMHRADRALYAAKRTGRDTIVAYEEGHTEWLLDEADETGRRASAREALVLLAESLDLRDPSTAAHSRTVGRYAAAIARHLGLEPRHVEQLQLAGALHDVGKLGMSDTLLLKGGPLTSEERRHVERHPELGARLLEGAGLDDVGEWVRCHHERVDGAGYPRGLRAGSIPLEARILGVADAFEAMTANRPYRRALDPAAARDELLRCAGSQFDARIVEVFLEVLAEMGRAEPVSADVAA